MGLVGRRVPSIKATRQFLSCVLLIAAVDGCAINRESAFVAPEQEFSRVKTVRIVTSATDERGMDRIIASALTKLGFEASLESDASRLKEVDAVLTYDARWNWDLTPYLLDLKISLRRPQSNELLAVGSSVHTSVTRKSADEMALEVLTNILKAADKKDRSN